MADYAQLVFEIDSSQARTAASDLAKVQNAANRVAAQWSKTDSAIRKANGQFAKSTDVVDKYGAEVRQLAAEFNPALNAVYRFQEAEIRLNRAVALGVLSVQQKDAALERLRVEYAATAAQAAGFNAATGAVAAGSGRMTSALTNASFQIQDFAVQVASGQSALVAFAQQFPQLAGALGFAGKAGLYGALIGTAAAIGVSVIPAFMNLGNETVKTSDSVDDLTASVTAYISAMQSAQGGLPALTAEFGNQAAAAREVFDIMARIESIKFMRETQTTINAINADFSAMFSTLSDIDSLGRAAAQNDQARADIARVLANELSAIKDEYGLSTVEANKLRTTMEMVNAATTDAERARAMKVLGEQLVTAAENGAKIPPEMLRVAENAITASRAILQMIGAMQTAQGTATSMMSDSRSEAIRENRAGVQDARAVELARVQNTWLNPSNDGSSGSSGGSSINDEMKSRWEALNNGFQSEFTLAMQHYDRDQETLKWALDQKLIAQETYQMNLDMLRVTAWGSEYEQNLLQYQMDQEALQVALDNKLLSEQQYLMKRRQLQWDYMAQSDSTNANLLSQELSNWGAHFGQMNQLAGGGYDSLLRLQRTFAASSALINTWKAYTDALAQGGLTPWQKLAWAGKMLSAGLGAVNAIKGGGGGGSSAASSAAAARQEPTRNILINLKDMGLGSRDAALVESVIQQIFEQSKDGRVIIARDR